MYKKTVLLALALLIPQAAYAHVKWFADFSFADKPLTLTETLTPLFWVMMVLSIVVIGLLVFLEPKIENAPVVGKLKEGLSQYQPYSPIIIRAAAAAVLLMCFQADALFVPELKIQNSLVIWLQFVFAMLLISPKTSPISGVGIIGLFLFGIARFGWFHLLDYVLFAGIGYYLTVQISSSDRVRESGLVALYITTGFSLCWVAIEKLLFPQWSLYILEQNPQLALGLNFKFFLTAAAFVEFSLGYLMIICLLQRPLALVVTAVFFMTTLVFGKTEIIGHTIIHAALIVFLIEGSGRFFKTPINLHNNLALKLAFASVNFAILLFVLLVPYHNVAQKQHRDFVKMRNEMAVVDMSHLAKPPVIHVMPHKDSHAGWNLQIHTENFSFEPLKAGAAHVDGEGHGHLYVNNKKMGRIYGDWHYVSGLRPGKNTVKVTLNSNDHKLLMYNGESIEHEVELDVEQGPMKMDHH